MPNTQMLGLMKMMRSLPIADYFEVNIPSIQIKKKSIKNLSKGDIIALQSHQILIDIVEDGDVVAHGIYGIFQDLPSVLIERFQEKRERDIDIKKFDTIDISLGQIKKSTLDQGKIIKIDGNAECDALLYRDKLLLARAMLVEVDGAMGLQIEEVK